MFRKKLIERHEKNPHKARHHVRWRSREVMRIEAFSDAVFAFAVTLLIVSLEVPETFDELMHIMSGFLAFAVSFLLLMQIWYSQYIYFRRYGIEDTYTIVLNSIMLFFILFYVYPLKFLFRMMLTIGTVQIETDKPIITLDQVPELMIIYGLGFASIYLILFLLYRYAVKKSAELELDEKEIFNTKTKMYLYSINTIIPLITIVAALILPENLAGLSGYIYFMLGPVIYIYYKVRGNRYKKLFSTE
ncbi:MAG: DUF1211 domain-containing protein [Ignavibacteria bacterium]|nr:DUF1211 domain-containing protein [Ignavibacteria bacterium]